MSGVNATPTTGVGYTNTSGYQKIENYDQQLCSIADRYGIDFKEKQDSVKNLANSIFIRAHKDGSFSIEEKPSLKQIWSGSDNWFVKCCKTVFLPFTKLICKTSSNSNDVIAADSFFKKLASNNSPENQTKIGFVHTVINQAIKNDSKNFSLGTPSWCNSKTLEKTFAMQRIEELSLQKFNKYTDTCDSILQEIEDKTKNEFTSLSDKQLSSKIDQILARSEYASFNKSQLKQMVKEEYAAIKEGHKHASQDKAQARKPEQREAEVVEAVSREPKTGAESAPDKNAPPTPRSPWTEEQRRKMGL